MITEPTVLVDEFGNVHALADELGRGGQGVVFRTRDPDVAVKLVLGDDGESTAGPGLADRLRAVRRLPVPRGLPLAMPAAVLRDRAGYAMRLLDGVVPFQHFYPPVDRGDRSPVGTGSTREAAPRPAWLAAVPDPAAAELQHYAETGGLRRRLLALYKCAAVLARLHAAGLVYGDVNPTNAYVAKDLASRAVWMIDADNLRFETEGRGPAVYFNDYGAPELVRGEDGGRPRTDCHAFAVMAFWILTLQNPFAGRYLDEGDDDWADENSPESRVEEARAGRIPWIDDPDDRRNAAGQKLRRDAILTADLRALFQDTFGPGRTNPDARPVIFHWPPALARALDATVACPECRLSYYPDPQRGCPFCGAALPAVLRATAVPGGAPAHAPSRWSWVREAPAVGGAVGLPHRLFFPFCPRDGDMDVLEIARHADHFRFRRPAHLDPRAPVLSIVPREGRPVEIAAHVDLPLAAVGGVRVSGATGRDVWLSLEGGES